MAAKDNRDMVPEFMRAVKEAKPRAFLMENVPGLSANGNAPYFFKILDQFKDLGYNINWKILNAAEYGIPQKRKRLFIIGFKTDFLILSCY